MEPEGAVISEATTATIEDQGTQSGAAPWWVAPVCPSNTKSLLNDHTTCVLGAIVACMDSTLSLLWLTIKSTPTATDISKAANGTFHPPLLSLHTLTDAQNRHKPVRVRDARTNAHNLLCFRSPDGSCVVTCDESNRMLITALPADCYTPAWSHQPATPITPVRRSTINSVTY